MSSGQEIRVRGLVQGVGFRPHVWHIASKAGLVGEVLNDGGGVLIRLRSGGENLLEALRKNAPPLARIDALELRPYAGKLPKSGFHIVASAGGAARTGITPDAATCPDCLAEVLDPKNHRHRYPFTNCTHCGPRLSITRAIPYDRANTTMSAFPMCPACQAEYDDPSNRRYHAQPNACPDCGPQLELVDAAGEPVAGDALAQTAALIRQGKIVAIKGLGGFQLAVDAGNEAAIARLRARKHRPRKPLALMVASLADAARLVALDAAAKALLTSWQAPIVLAPRRGTVALSVAPDQPRLGVMLPNTPLHHLLLRALKSPIVLTSGNLSGDPQITDNAEALQKLSPVADAFLLHNRDIANRLDDSVMLPPHTLRRARGYAPAPLLLHKGFADLPKVLALGTDLKNTFCLLADARATLSQHMGDMDSPTTQRDVRKNLALYQQIYGFTPERIAVDMHPGYFSTRVGQRLGEVEEVQHHHAHIAAVMAEHGLPPDAPAVLGVVLDGLGWGDDGTLWGGEFLAANFSTYTRLAHITPVPLIGGDKANRQPWRNLLAHLHMAGLPPPALPDKPVDMMLDMLARGLNCPLVSSTGRLFDAAAAALGLCPDTISYEGEAAMALQALAETCPAEAGHYPVETTAIWSWSPLWRGLLRDQKTGVAKAIIARRFHNSLIEAISQKAIELAANLPTETVVLSGGVMQNRLLLIGLLKRLKESGLRPITPRKIPANDGGISLGQSTIAATDLK